MNEPGIAIRLAIVRALAYFPVVFRKWFGQTDIESEIGEVLFNIPEVFGIK